ncbi:hypothetical protein F5884DRAFT_62088 [Xylogone sp. PMI_703]|nr:hypothetical protein F5884DRAFT_62088 [Xylogone sp. PMI_703]
MKLQTLILPFLATYAAAYVGEICSDGTEEYGICVDSTWCQSNGGNSIPGFCSNAPEGVECCFGPNCTGRKGFCWDTEGSLCAQAGGHFVPGHCPGPFQYQCCVDSTVQKRVAGALKD